MCKPLYRFLFYLSMVVGVSLIGGDSSGRTYHNIFPQYSIDRSVILSNLVTRKVVVGLKEVGEAQLVGDNWK